MICYISASISIKSQPHHELSLLKWITQLPQKYALLHVQCKPCTVELICYNKGPQAWSLKRNSTSKGMTEWKASWYQSLYLTFAMNTSVRDRPCFENSSVLLVVYKYYWCWLIKQMLIKTAELKSKGNLFCLICMDSFVTKALHETAL